MKKVRRFLKRNCIKIPFWIAIIALFGFASHLDRPIPDRTEKAPVAAAEITTAYAAEAEGETSVEEAIKYACEKYDIPHDVALAISKLETGHYTSTAYTELNNVGGLSIEEEPIAFDTLYDGVEAFVQNLAYAYYAEGLTTPEEIGEKYCPINAEAWADTVKKLMEEA